MGELIGGHFEIVEPIGQGGMGVVYRGVDKQNGLPVAIKLLKQEIINNKGELLERFEREGEALRRLNHPNIVKMLAAINENDQHYLVMEYVGGGSLQDLMDRDERLPVARVLEIGLELADALSRAHHLKIIHRDIKPANVLLAEDGTPRLTDFGIARLDDQSRITETGLVVGTFAYISPEACEGRVLDARADIWSLGVMLYEMLAAKRPFQGEQMASTITAILTKPPPNLAELRPDAPYPLVDLINRILEKDRDKRNISARQVGAELEAILHGETTPAQPVKSRFYTPVPTPPPTSALPSSTSIIHTPTGRVAGEELDGSTELGMKPVTATFSPTAPPSKLPLIMGSIVTILVIAAGVFFFAARRAAVPIVPTAIIKTVSTPAAKDEYVVLVAPLQAVRAQERDSSRLIVSDLKQRLEVEAPFSKIRIRQYATVIASHDEAQAAAQAEGATLVVWGTYDENGLQLNLQIGDISAFKYNSFNRDLLERTTNVRITITDESRQSIAPQVLGAIGVLAIADGDVYEFGRMLAIMDTLKVSGAEVTGDSVAARVQRYFGAYLHNTNDAFTAADQAITSDSSNAILYALRSQARWQILAQTGGSPGVTEVDNADRDARTAQRLASEQWALPYILFRSSAYASYRASLYDQNLANLSKMIELRPDDWYLRLSRGIVYYQIKQYDQAEKDIDDGIALKPDTSFPYSFAVVLSLRKGNLQQAADLTDTIVRDLPPDPAFFTRLEKALFGDNTGLGGSMFPVFSRLILDQYNDAIQMVQNSAKDGSLPQGTILIDVNMMQGVAQCNLGRYDKAVNLYNLFIPTNSDYPLLLLLRADSLLAQNKNDLGRKDIAKLMQSKNADTFAPFAMAVMNSEFGCKDLFDKRKIATVQAKYGATKAAAINGMLTGQAPTPKPEGTASQ